VLVILLTRRLKKIRKQKMESENKARNSSYVAYSPAHLVWRDLSRVLERHVDFYLEKTKEKNISYSVAKISTCFIVMFVRTLLLQALL